MKSISKNKRKKYGQQHGPAITKQSQNQTQVVQSFLYKPETLLPDLSGYIGQTIEMKVAKKYISRYNKMVIQRQVWGNDQYTSNSDAVCMLIHSGKVQFESKEINDNQYQGVSLQLKVSKQKKTYAGGLKNGLASRQTKKYQGYSLKPENVTWLTQLGSAKDLQEAASRMCIQMGRKRIKQENLPKYNQLIPIPEVNIVFNMNNDPAFKFSITNICDKSQDYKTWLSYRLKTSVLYIDNDTSRYEISRMESAEDQNDDDKMFDQYDQYKLCKVRDPLLLDNEAMAALNRPLDNNYIEVIYKDLGWDKFLWGSNSLLVNKILIDNLRSFKFYPIQKL